jgi:hypothetical protein
MRLWPVFPLSITAEPSGPITGRACTDLYDKPRFSAVCSTRLVGRFCGVPHKDLFELCPSLRQQLAQYGPVTARLVLAVTTHRDICVMRQCGKQIKNPALFWIGHLGEIFPDKCAPVFFGFSSPPQCHEFRGWCYVWEPNVIPIFRCVFALRYATWRTPHRPDAQSFSTKPVGAETHDSDGHDISPLWWEIWGAMPNALRIRSKTGGKLVCRRDCLLHSLAVRREGPNSKWMESAVRCRGRAVVGDSELQGVNRL